MEKKTPDGEVRCFLWSWRESNPRPNKEPIGFLHAYPDLNFHAMTGIRQPIVALSPDFHCYFGAKQQLFLYWSAPRDPDGTGHYLRRDVPSQHLVPGFMLNLLLLRLSGESVIRFAS